jgi:hypothetical protein
VSPILDVTCSGQLFVVLLRHPKVDESLLCMFSSSVYSCAYATQITLYALCANMNQRYAQSQYTGCECCYINRETASEVLER